jgi:hypothetical protein
MHVKAENRKNLGKKEVFMETPRLFSGAAEEK